MARREKKFSHAEKSQLIYADWDAAAAFFAVVIFIQIQCALYISTEWLKMLPEREHVSAIKVKKRREQKWTEKNIFNENENPSLSRCLLSANFAGENVNLYKRGKKRRCRAKIVKSNGA